MMSLCDPLNLSSFHVSVDSDDCSFTHDELLVMVDKMSSMGQKLLEDLENAKQGTLSGKFEFSSTSLINESSANSFPETQRADKEMSAVHERCLRLEDAILSLQEENAQLIKQLKQSHKMCESCSHPLQNTCQCKKKTDKNLKQPHLIEECSHASDTEKELNSACRNLEEKVRHLQKENQRYLRRLKENDEQANLRQKQLDYQEMYKQRIDDLHISLLTKEKEIENLKGALKKAYKSLSDLQKKESSLLERDISKRKEVLLLCEKYEELKKNIQRLESSLVKSRTREHNSVKKIHELERNLHAKRRKAHTMDLEVDEGRKFRRHLNSQFNISMESSKSVSFDLGSFEKLPKKSIPGNHQSLQRSSSSASSSGFRFSMSERPCDTHKHDYVRLIKGTGLRKIPRIYERAYSLEKFADCSPSNEIKQRKEQNMISSICSQAKTDSLDKEEHFVKRQSNQQLKGILKNSNGQKSERFQSPRERHPLIINERYVTCGNYPKYKEVDIIDIVSKKSAFDYPQDSLARSLLEEHRRTKESVHGYDISSKAPLLQTSQVTDVSKEDYAETLSSVSSTSDHIGRFEFLQEMQSSMKNSKFFHERENQDNQSINSTNTDSSGSEIGLSARQQEYAEKLVRKYTERL